MYRIGGRHGSTAVSYTHLDVYKRQPHCNLFVRKNQDFFHKKERIPRENKEKERPESKDATI